MNTFSFHQIFKAQNCNVNTDPETNRQRILYDGRGYVVDGCFNMWLRQYLYSKGCELYHFKGRDPDLSGMTKEEILNRFIDARLFGFVARNGKEKINASRAFNLICCVTYEPILFENNHIQDSAFFTVNAMLSGLASEKNLVKANDVVLLEEAFKNWNKTLDDFRRDKISIVFTDVVDTKTRLIPTGLDTTFNHFLKAKLG